MSQTQAGSRMTDLCNELSSDLATVRIECQRMTERNAELLHACRYAMAHIVSGDTTEQMALRELCQAIARATGGQP